MAGLALIFSLAIVVKPHFLLLDEVDAHLDAKNTALLTKFLAEKREDLPQTLLISHKESAVATC